MGESRGIDDFADSTSKLGSAVQINSIAIDISGSMEAMESPVHEHFSIRWVPLLFIGTSLISCIIFFSSEPRFLILSSLAKLVISFFRSLPHSFSY